MHFTENQKDSQKRRRLQVSLGALVLLAVLLPYQNCTQRMNPMGTFNANSSTASMTSCSFNGATIPNGGSAAGFAAPYVAFGTSCSTVAINVTCSNGTLNPQNAVASCAVAPQTSCVFGGNIIANNSTTIGYTAATVPAGYLCSSVAETVTCSNGSIVPANALPSCTVSPTVACSYGAGLKDLDSYNYNSAGVTFGYGVTSDTIGNIFTVGGYDKNGAFTSVVRRSTDGGNTWATVDALVNVGLTISSGFTIGTDSLGNVFSSSVDYTANSWVTRKSVDQGTTWTTSDNFNVGVAGAAPALSFLADNSGNIFVAGSGASSMAPSGIIRRSTDHGATWSTVDTFMYSGAGGISPGEMTLDNSGNILIVESLIDSAGANHWVLRKSPDHGTTWSTVYDYRETGSTSSELASVLVDSKGNIYVADSAYNIGRWEVYKSTNNGASWSVSDNYTISNNVAAQKIWADTIGNIFVAGEAFINGAYNVVVRKSTDSGASWSTLVEVPTANNSPRFAFTLDSSGDLILTSGLPAPLNSLYTAKISCH